MKGKPPETGKQKGVGGIAEIERKTGITLAFQGQDSVGAGLNSTLDHAGKVNAQERKHRIGHRINQMANEMAALGPQIVVFSTEWNDAVGWPQPGSSRNPVALKPRAIDEKIGFDGISGGRLDAPRQRIMP